MQSDCPERARTDVPAALPLIAYIAGLTCFRSLRDAIGFALVALLLAMIRRPRAAIVSAAAAAGIVAALHQATIRETEARALTEVGDTTFTSIGAPIDRDWMNRGDAYVLRVPRFRASHFAFVQPLAIYARFQPKTMGMEKWIRAEGFLHRNDRGELTITVKSPRLLSYHGALSALHPAAWNRALANRMRPLAAEFPDEVALIDALALGRGERLADEIRDNYKRGGTYHLLVFSGLQIAFAAGVIVFFLRSLHAPRTSDWSLLLFSIAAPMFIGPTASVSRASIGIGLYAVSRILHRPTSLENLWCIAALLQLILAPRDLTDAAFQLTYAGAGALLFIGKPLARGRARWLAYALGAECTVMPLTLFHFHQYALGGSLTTLLLTPVIFVMLIVSAIACVAPVRLLMQVIALLHRLCTFVNGAAAVFAGWYAAPPLAILIAGFALALLAIAFLAARKRAVAIIAAALLPSIAAMVVAHRPFTAATLTVLDVGQGDSIVIRTPGNSILIDAGSRYANVAPRLLDAGIRQLDAVVLTHVHPDHCGGMPEVLTHLKVKALWISPRRFSGDCAQRLLDAASLELVPIHLVRDSETKAFGAIGVRALLASRTFKRSAENNSSVVLHVSLGSKTIVLTGDIERESEADLASRLFRADILKVAHHGSRSSTAAAFLEAAAPRIALISCGRRNLFGHPHAEVIEALRQRRIRIYRTDLDGSIDVEVDGGHIFVRHQIDTPP